MPSMRELSSRAAHRSCVLLLLSIAFSSSLAPLVPAPFSLIRGAECRRPNCGLDVPDTCLNRFAQLAQSGSSDGPDRLDPFTPAFPASSFKASSVTIV